MSKKFRVATFNANSLRSRLEIVLGWLQANEPDALCVQETRVMDTHFPVDAFAEIGYKAAFVGQKSFNGVAIISREEPEEVVIGMEMADMDEEARLIRARIGGVEVVNAYVPQGTSPDSPRFAYKLRWIAAMKDYFTRDFTPDSNIVWVGDFNVAPTPMDVYDPERLRGCVCFHPDEQAALESVRQWGFVDVFRQCHPNEPRLYSFFDYRIPSAFKRKLGWRIDHIWATQPMADRLVDCRIDLEPRLLEKPSDHTFVVADFDFT